MSESREVVKELTPEEQAAQDKAIAEAKAKVTEQPADAGSGG